MVANRMEPIRPGGETPKGGNPETGPASAAAPKNAGLKAWLPLMVTTITMPLVAYATTAWVLAPRLERATGNLASEAVKAPVKGSKPAQGQPATKKKVTVPLVNKVITNVAGSAGTRYLMTKMSLVGYGEEFKALIAENMDQILALANTTLASKTINDLEQPGIRNLIRTELITVFNNALGQVAVHEIYLVDFVVQ